MQLKKRTDIADILASIRSLEEVLIKASALSNARRTRSDQQITSTRNSQTKHVCIKQAAVPPKERKSIVTSACLSPVNKTTESSKDTGWAPVVCHAITQRCEQMQKLKELFGAGSREYGQPGQDSDKEAR